MYQEYFGLTEAPFSITPDTSYFYAYGHYSEALNTLLIALRAGEGFIKVTGEVGTGKTLLCRKLLNTVEERFVTAYIPNPMLTPYGLQSAVAEELGLDISRHYGHHQLLKMINNRLLELTAEGKNVVLCIDESQAMPADTMEGLRLLTNLETEKQKLLQVILFGQPELDDHLNEKEVRQLKQRITFSYQLKPIDREGMESYLTHRLGVAGYKGGNLFAIKAMNSLHKASRGIPRLINILSHKSMMSAYGEGTKFVDVKNMQAAIKDTEDTQLRSADKNYTVWIGAFISVLVLTVIAFVLFR
ncbi:MAG: AAA family ATPase [Gammaproteobacteria bacterium]|nr:AAA family ATPase [Gammaproteobacteria bacterium]MDH5660428.1 AAA family ATPase [Gammaproteobacteria bacterium]